MVTRRMLIAGMTAAALPLPALAQDPFNSRDLRRGRATVPVFLNDQGPFQFMVDTAANASVVADDLAQRLQLPSLGTIGMHTLVGREVVPSVRAARMRSGSLDAHEVRLAVGQRLAMGGLDGLLGCDLLADRKLILNFRGTDSARIARSSAPPQSFRSGDTNIPAVVIGERRFGNLLMVPALVGRTSATAIIDSGAEGTILNRAAAVAGRAVPLVPHDGQDIRRVQSPTGEFTMGHAMLLPAMTLAGLTISSLPVAVGDFHSFGVWGLADRPAMLVGLDVLGLFSAVHIDLKRRELSLQG
ncbi:hypothetical protein BH10PSE1_BH10PSE1_10520 [soil metagenome]